MDIPALRRQHLSIIDKASVLGGLCRRVARRDDAREICRLIADLDMDILEHLTIEDAELYPLLMNARDEGLRILGAEAFEGIGGLLGIWVRFRDHWTMTAMLADPRRFAVAAGSVLGALSVRIEMEEDSLYPAAEAEARRGRRIIAIA